MVKERNNKKDKYSVTEVGTLIESFQKNISLIAEEVRGLSDWRGGVDIHLEAIGGGLTLVEDGLKAVADRTGRVEGRMTTLEGRMGRLEDAVLSTTSRLTRLETKAGL